MEQKTGKTEVGANGKDPTPGGDGQTVIGKFECRRDGAAQAAPQEARRWGYPHGGYLENALGKELAWMLRGNRCRILKAFAAALDHSAGGSK